jgi:cell division protein FtsB
VIANFITFIREHQKWIVLAVIGFILYSFLAGDTGFFQIGKLMLKNQRLKIQVQKAEEQNAFLKTEAQDLNNDLSRIEREAREQYGLAKEDEIVIKVRDAEP